ncbi:lipocalin-like domain-containing protein [Vibrio sagamiensis]|nr:carotenoid 1,2-hydratase [Vibrio agarivorans]
MFYFKYWFAHSSMFEGMVKPTNFHQGQENKQKVIFDPVTPDHSASLPRDFGIHPSYQHEWWNYYATTKGNNGQNYFIQWVFFRIAVDERNGRGWQNPQLYLSYIVISNGTQVWKEQRIARGGIGQAGMTSPPFQLWLDNWKWRSVSANPFPGTLEVSTDLFSVHLKTSTSGPFLANGDKGFKIKHKLQSIASFNFSAPFLSIEGTLNLDGQAIEIEGNAWVNKEWGSDLVGNDQQGWDWFAFHLEDDRMLTVSRYRYHGQTSYLSGMLATRAGKSISLDEQELIITPIKNTQLTDQHLVPLHWNIRVPKYNINLTVRAIKTEMWLPFLIPYWEGPITTTGSQRAYGFMQLMGY